jgi:hypothetical protein
MKILNKLFFILLATSLSSSLTAMNLGDDDKADEEHDESIEDDNIFKDLNLDNLAKKVTKRICSIIPEHINKNHSAELVKISECENSAQVFYCTNLPETKQQELKKKVEKESKKCPLPPKLRNQQLEPLDDNICTIEKINYNNYANYDIELYVIENY